MQMLVYTIFFFQLQGNYTCYFIVSYFLGVIYNNTFLLFITHQCCSNVFPECDYSNNIYLQFLFYHKYCLIISMAYEFSNK